jgi:hypothetical protein
MSKWSKDVRFALRSGLHRYNQFGFQQVIDRLINAENSALDPLAGNDILSVTISTYVSTAKVVGAPMEYCQEQHTDLLEDGSIIVLRGFPKIPLLRYLSERADLSPDIFLARLCLPHAYPVYSRISKVIAWINTKRRIWNWWSIQRQLQR